MTSVLGFCSIFYVVWIGCENCCSLLIVLITPANEVWGKVMFLHLCVILFPVGRGWLPSMHHGSHDQHPGGVCFQAGSGSRGVCLQAGSGSRGVFIQGVCLRGVCLQGGSASTGFAYRGSASRGVCIQGVCLQGGGSASKVSRKA